MSGKKFKLFIIFLLLISVAKLVFGAPYHHEDADQFFYWGKSLAEKGFNRFYEVDVPNASRPTYPPILYYVLNITRKLYRFIHDFTWYFHLRIPFYYFRKNTSLFIPWLETKLGAVTFNKIPAILADLVNSLIIFNLIMLISKGKKEKTALFLASIFILSPAVWYSSSVWGQLDSFFIMFLLISLRFLLKEKYFFSIIFLLLSVLTKPTAVYSALVFALVFLKKTHWKVWLKAAVYSSAMVIILYYPFNPGENIRWIGRFFQSSLAGELNQMVSNAFNFWVLPLGFNNYPDSTKALGLPLYQWGYGLFGVASLVLISLFWGIRKKMSAKRIILGGFLFSLLAFLVLPRVHERYFYPALVFSLLLAQFGKDWLLIYLVLSTIHFFNLYHFWWIPRFEPLVIFLSNIIVVKLMVLTEIGIFAYGLVKLSKEEA